jgi:DNA-binding beta-propeller fold protein YncE
LSNGAKLGSVSHIAIDSKDRIYFFQRKNPPVLVFDEEGNLLDSWGENILVDAHGVYITPEDTIFAVARGLHEVIKFDINGRLLLRIGSRENPSWQKPFNHPTDVAVSRSGEIFVADGYGNSRVHKFSSEGELIISWGEPGKQQGQFHTPHGIWVEKDVVYVADRDNNRIQLFDSVGNFIDEWRDFYHPMDIYMNSLGNFVVTDQTPRFTVLNSEGTVLARGFAPNAGHGIWESTSNDIYLAGLEKGVVKLIKLKQ